MDVVLSTVTDAAISELIELTLRTVPAVAEVGNDKVAKVIRTLVYLREMTWAQRLKRVFKID